MEGVVLLATFAQRWRLEVGRTGSDSAASEDHASPAAGNQNGGAPTIIGAFMGQPIGTAAVHRHDHEADAEAGWSLVQAAARAAEGLGEADTCSIFALAPDGQLRAVPAGDPDGLIAWRPGAGWEALLPLDDPRRALHRSVSADLQRDHGPTDHRGTSGPEPRRVHCHTCRRVALGDRGAEHPAHASPACALRCRGGGRRYRGGRRSAAHDAARAGRNPLRVVIDPGRRLGGRSSRLRRRWGGDVYVCARSLTRPGERHIGRAVILGVEERGDGIDLAELMRELRARGCARVFVEGGGVTVSMFLAANLLDRLQVAIAPLIIGDGRPAIRLPPPLALGDCLRPRYRVFCYGRRRAVRLRIRRQPGGRSPASAVRPRRQPSLG